MQQPEYGKIFNRWKSIAQKFMSQMHDLELIRHTLPDVGVEVFILAQVTNDSFQ